MNSKDREKDEKKEKDDIMNVRTSKAKKKKDTNNRWPALKTQIRRKELRRTKFAPWRERRQV